VVYYFKNCLLEVVIALQRKSIVFLINIVVISLLFLLMKDLTFVNYINSIFYIAFLYIIVFLFLVTLKGGFYDGITYSFRRFNAVMFKKDYLEEWKEKPLPSETFNENFYEIIKSQAIYLFLLLGLFLCLYYFL